jgi:hypothetical protein
MNTKKKQPSKTTGERKQDRKAAAPKPETKRTIKQVVIETIAANNTVTNEEMIAAVMAEFPRSAFKDSHAAWYRSQARKGLLTGTPIEIPAQARKQSEAN